MKTFEIFFDDLDESAQNKLLEEFDTEFEDENWEHIALAVVERESIDE